MNLEEQIAQIINPQEFTRLCNAILTARYGDDFQVIDGTRSDEGNDGYINSEKRIIAIYCPIKPERRTDSDYLKKIRSDLEKANDLRRSGKFEVESWTFLTPRKLSNSVIVDMREYASSVGISATHQEATFLAGELSKNRHLIQEFPWLYSPDVDGKLDEIITLLKQGVLKTSTKETEIDSKHIYRRETDNKEELERVLNLRRNPDGAKIKPDLKTIYYTSVDPAVKLNALLGLLDFFDPIGDSADDFVQLCDEGIQISVKVGAPSLQANLLAQKGYLLSFIYSGLDMHTASQIRVANAIGIPTITEEYRLAVVKRLHGLEDQFTRSFDEAINIAKQVQDLPILASVLVFVGNAAGQRAQYLQLLNVKETAASDRQTCKRALLAAKDIYVHLNDELGKATALFNLANQIRFFGEEKEAAALTENAIQVATKYGDSRLLQRAVWLKKTLETGKIPNYIAGERRK